VTMTSDRWRQKYCPLFDVHPVTGATTEVFYADGLATFGSSGAGGSGDFADAARRQRVRRRAHSLQAIRHSAGIGQLRSRRPSEFRATWRLAKIVVAKRLHWRTGRKGPTKLSRDFRSNFRHFNGAQGRNRICSYLIEIT
jgi:hypothetical protein